MKIDRADLSCDVRSFVQERIGKRRNVAFVPSFYTSGLSKIHTEETIFLWKE